MENGQPALAEANEQVESSNNTELQQKEVKPDVAVELATISERYKHSSQEGVRLHQENKDLKARLDSLEKNSSLTKQSNENRLPDEETYVKWWTDNGEKTEKEARAEFKREYVQEAKFLALEETNRALMRRLQFEEEQREKGVLSINPLAIEANEFFKDIPEVNSLPLTDKIERYKIFQSKGIIPKSPGRDLTAIKSAAGTSIGSGSKSTVSPNTAFDDAARAAGFKSYQAQQELNKCQTQADYNTWNAKWNKK